MDIAQILTRKYPGTLWRLDGTTYDGLTWLDESNKPTEKELMAQWPDVQSEILQDENQLIAARDAAIAHAKSLGFTDEMIAIMYPGLLV